MRELARQHEVHAIILQPLKELRSHHASYIFPDNVRVYGPAQTPPPKTVFHRLPPRIGKALQYRWLRRSPRGPANSVLLMTHHLIEDVLRKQEIDIALFEHLDGLLTAPLVRRLSRRTLRLFDDCNVESELFLQVATAGSIPSRRRTYERMRWLESHISSYADAFWACSDIDREKLEAMNQGKGRGFTIPNAVNTLSLPFDPRPEKASSKQILFCGSLSTPANRNGLTWFHEKVWPRVLTVLPGVRLLVIGKGAPPEDYRSIRSDPSVDWAGEVDNVVPFYHQAGAAITPLLEGSGTRIKILEALSLGNPMVSTTIGAEGLDLEPEKHILIADAPEAFANSLHRLLTSRELFDRLRSAGREAVEKKYMLASRRAARQRICRTAPASERNQGPAIALGENRKSLENAVRQRPDDRL